MKITDKNNKILMKVIHKKKKKKKKERERKKKKKKEGTNEGNPLPLESSLLHDACCKCPIIYFLIPSFYVCMLLAMYHSAPNLSSFFKQSFSGSPNLG
jgi:hypothetical protein